jgi:DinB superfamily
MHRLKGDFVMPIATLEQIGHYEMAPSLVVAALEGLDETQLHYVPKEGEWSIHEIVIHLADSETMGYWRLRKTLAEEGSILPVYDEAAWAQKLSYRTQERRLAIALFTNLRASTAALLRSLPTEAWERTSNHPEHGTINVYDLFTIYLQHGEIHLQQIERIKQIFLTIA